MKLLVNATPLIPPLSGIGRYTQQLLLNLYNENRIEEIDGFLPYAFYSRQKLLRMLEALDYQDKKSLNSNAGASSGIARIKSIAKKIPAARYIKKQLQELMVERKFQQYKDRVYWESNYVLAPFEGKKVATVYDLSHIRFPDFHPTDRLQWLDKHLPHTINTADALIAISEFSKQELISVFNVPEEKISIVPPAVSPMFRTTFSPENVVQFRQEYQLPEQFILSVGTLEPRKNIKGLIQAFSRLPSSLRRSFPLVFAGAQGWHMEEIEAVLRPLLKRGEVILLGYVAQQDMPILYTSATLFAYISLYEGYGMPVAEAMCSGTAVLTSNITSMPEVAAGSCELVDPNHIEQISIKLQTLIEAPSLRKQLQEKAKFVSDSYRWENSSARLLEVFAAVM